MKKAIIAVALLSMLTLLVVKPAKADQVATDTKTVPAMVIPTDEPMMAPKPITKDMLLKAPSTSECVYLAGSVSNETWLDMGCDQVVDLD